MASHQLREVRGRAEPEHPEEPAGPRTGMFEAAEDGLERIWSGLAASPAATAVVDADGGFLRVNQPMCDLLGHTEPALLATGFPAVLHREDADADLQQLSRVMAGEQPGYRLRQRCRRADGAVVPVLGGAWLPLSTWGEALHLDRKGRPRYVIRQLVDLRDDATRDASPACPTAACCSTGCTWSRPATRVSRAWRRCWRWTSTGSAL
jgi:PAS domain S-box-containing protein